MGVTWDGVRLFERNGKHWSLRLIVERSSDISYERFPTLM
jgi:hypothetical protein